LVEFLKAEYDVDALEEVNYGQIRSWIVSLSENGISNRSINRKISSLKTFYRFLLKIRVVEVSPLAKHQPLKTMKQIQVPFSEKEMNRLKEISFPDDFNGVREDRKSTRLNSSHVKISYAVFCLKKKIVDEAE